MNQENIWNSYSPKQCRELEELSAAYRDFLDNGKTEREAQSSEQKLAETG